MCLTLDLALWSNTTPPCLRTCSGANSFIAHQFSVSVTSFFVSVRQLRSTSSIIPFATLFICRGVNLHTFLLPMIIGRCPNFRNLGPRGRCGTGCVHGNSAVVSGSSRQCPVMVAGLYPRPPMFASHFAVRKLLASRIGEAGLRFGNRMIYESGWIQEGKSAI